MGILTKNSSEKSNAPHMLGVLGVLGLNIDTCIIITFIYHSLSFSMYTTAD